MATLRIKREVTFQSTGDKIPAGIVEVGKGITKEQYEQIKDRTRLCEVLDDEKPVKKEKPAEKPTEKDAD